MSRNTVLDNVEDYSLMYKFAKPLLCYLGLHARQETLYRAGDSWAEPGKPIVMLACRCGKIFGYVRDASFVEIKWNRVLPQVTHAYREKSEQ